GKKSSSQPSIPSLAPSNASQPLILVLVHQPIRNERIAKVELAVYGVGQGGKVMGLFWGAKVEVRVTGMMNSDRWDWRELVVWYC
ncbi:hypothetical protein Tco_0162136, partial [Tanacetum coccineum]